MKTPSEALGVPQNPPIGATTHVPEMKLLGFL